MLMSKTMSATDVRVHFGEVIRSVNTSDDHIVVEKDGKPAAIILSPRRFEELTRRYDTEEIIERARLSREKVATWFKDQPFPDVDELINFGRDDGV
jgi:prevent-host-death family protein